MLDVVLGGGTTVACESTTHTTDIFLPAQRCPKWSTRVVSFGADGVSRVSTILVFLPHQCGVHVDGSTRSSTAQLVQHVVQTLERLRLPSEVLNNKKTVMIGCAQVCFVPSQPCSAPRRYDAQTRKVQTLFGCGNCNISLIAVSPSFRLPHMASGRPCVRLPQSPLLRLPLGRQICRWRWLLRTPFLPKTTVHADIAKCARRSGDPYSAHFDMERVFSSRATTIPLESLFGARSTGAPPP